MSTPTPEKSAEEHRLEMQLEVELTVAAGKRAIAHAEHELGQVRARLDAAQAQVNQARAALAELEAAQKVRPSDG